jgi:hypothetical protein
MSEEIQAKSELETLKERADKMGVKYHPNVGVETLRERVNAALAGETTEESKEAEKSSEEETEGQRKQRMKKEALKLVRVRVTNMNPNKKEWEGEILTVSNAVLGTVKRFVQFNEEWHVEQIILNAMKERQCQIFQKARGPRGEQIVKPKLIKEFNIEILPPLTEKELKELAQRQAMANGTSE